MDPQELWWLWEAVLPVQTYGKMTEDEVESLYQFNTELGVFG